MSATATLEPPVDETVLDGLVPPPGPRWRRAVAWLAFLAVAALAMWATATGTVVPQVDSSVQAWGGSGPVGVSVSVSNSSRVPIEVVSGPEAPPGMTALGTTTGPLTEAGLVLTKEASDPFPIRLGPDESTNLTFWFTVTDCDAVLRETQGDDQIDLEVRIADGPASLHTSSRPIDATDLAFRPDRDPSWPVAMAEHACPS